jgi:starch synthase
MGGAAGWLKSTLARPDVAAKYFGVLNGIDTGSWDPATDPTLPANFSAEDPEGKALCKKYLQMGLGLEVNPDKPLVAVISRLVPQKGIHLIEHAAHTVVGEKGGQFVVLGSGHAEGGLRGLANNNPNFGNNKYSAHFMYSEKLSRLIYAAADIFLVPSMFEPCGLTQMIALRYGCIPIVRKTGGLADTVHDVVEDSRGGNGFVFDGIDGGSLDVSLTAAFDFYKEKKQWDSLRRRVMAESGRWSWGEASNEYLKIYRDCLAK